MKEWMEATDLSSPSFKSSRSLRASATQPKGLPLGCSIQE